MAIQSPERVSGRRPARTRDQDLRVLIGLPTFRACARRELALVRRLVEDVTLPSGHVLVTERNAGREFFVIVEGHAAVTRDGQPVALLGPGDFFGELSLLLAADAQRATVTAISPLRALVLGRQQFLGLLAEVPSFSRAVLVGMARRLREANERSGPDPE